MYAYIDCINKIWGKYHQNDSGQLSDRTRAIIKDYINELLDALVTSLFAEDVHHNSYRPLESQPLILRDTMNRHYDEGM